MMNINEEKRKEKGNERKVGEIKRLKKLRKEENRRVKERTRMGEHK